MSYRIEAHVSCGESPVLGFYLGMAREPEPYKLSRRNKDNGFTVEGVNFTDGSKLEMEHRAVTNTRAELLFFLYDGPPSPKFIYSLWSSGCGGMTTRRDKAGMLVKIRRGTTGYSGHGSMLESVKLFHRTVRSLAPRKKMPAKPLYALTQLSWNGDLPKAARKAFTRAVWGACGGVLRGVEIFHDKAEGEWANQMTCHPAGDGRLLELDDLIHVVDDVDKRIYDWVTKEG